MEFLAEDKYVRVLGRTLMLDGVRYLNYTCASIEFIFTGTKAEAVLWTDSPKLEAMHAAWVAVFIDDEEVPSRRFPLEEAERTYVLYEGKAVKETKLRLVKYSEVQYGMVGIKKLILNSDTPPVPAAGKERKLEFIGDSITCGYGNEGVFDIDIFQTSQENAWEAYAAITARALNADSHMISWSGIGIQSSYTETDVPNVSQLMPDLYPYTDREADLRLGNPILELWDNRRYVPDCIVINLGTNDNSYTKEIPDRVERFGLRYYQFVKQVRSSNPTSVILCTLGAMGQQLCEAVRQQVEKLNTEGDKKLYYMPFELQKDEDGLGTNWHPSKPTHKKMAVKLEKEIRKIMGW